MNQPDKNPDIRTGFYIATDNISFLQVVQALDLSIHLLATSNCEEATIKIVYILQYSLNHA